MDKQSTFSRIAFGFAARIIAASIAIWVASYAAIAFCDAAARISAALPHG